jgi:hypothetical protein
MYKTYMMAITLMAAAFEVGGFGFSKPKDLN